MNLKYCEKLTEEWAFALGDSYPSRILSLYADEAILWGTFSTKCLHSFVDISSYFNNIFLLAKHEVVFNDDKVITLHDGVIVSAGTYVFSLERANKIVKTLARYSFTHVKCGNCWKILSHHSSILPEG